MCRSGRHIVSDEEAAALAEVSRADVADTAAFVTSSPDANPQPKVSQSPVIPQASPPILANR